MSRVVTIQYLRAIAATMVVIFHIDHRFFIGGGGVDIFFVVSGFVMWTTTAGRDMAPADFLAKRFLRVAPLYWGATIVLSGAGALVPALFPHLILSPLRFVQSIAFVPHLDTGLGFIAPILTHGWSLNFEMAFYALVAVGLLIPERARLGAIVSALAALALYGWTLSDKGPMVATYTSPLLLEFGAGLAVGAAFKSGRLPSRGAAMALFGAGLAGFCLAVFWGEPAETARVMVWGIPAMLIVLGAVGLERAGVAPSWKGLALLGDASYSLYLSHTFMISLVHKFAGAKAPVWIEEPILAVLCLTFGVMVYRIVETPMMKMLNSLTRVAPRRGALAPVPEAALRASALELGAARP